VSAGRSVALAGFSIRANLRSYLTLGGLVAFAAIALLGPVASLRNGHGWALDPDLLFYGYLTGGLFVLRSGLEQQREAGLQTFLRHNFCTPLEHGAGAVLALMGTWLLLTGLLFLLGLLCSAGDMAAAAWHAWSFGLALALLLPFVIMVESVSSLRIPMILPLIGYLALMVILALTVGEVRMVAILGVSVDRSDPASSLALAGRAGIVVTVGMPSFVAAVALLDRRRGGSGPGVS
jgi:hypothetical protein